MISHEQLSRYDASTVAERRKLTRFAVSAPVRLMVGRGDAAEQFDAQARDLSAAGAYIYFADPRLDVGDTVRIEIRLTVTDRQGEGDAQLEVPMVSTGEIRRVDSNGLALAFDHQLRFA